MARGLRVDVTAHIVQREEVLTRVVDTQGRDTEVLQETLRQGVTQLEVLQTHVMRVLQPEGRDCFVVISLTSEVDARHLARGLVCAPGITPLSRG